MLDKVCLMRQNKHDCGNPYPRFSLVERWIPGQMVMPHLPRRRMMREFCHSATEVFPAPEDEAAADVPAAGQRQR